MPTADQKKKAQVHLPSVVGAHTPVHLASFRLKLQTDYNTTSSLPELCLKAAKNIQTMFVYGTAQSQNLRAKTNLYSDYLTFYEPQACSVIP